MPARGTPAARRETSDGPGRLWTAEEANARLPALRELLPNLRAWAGRLTEVHGELARLARFWGEELGARDHPDHGLKERLEAEWRNLTRRLDESVRALAAEGIEVKQLESGLVDFYGLLDGELVYLCWRLDEGEVGFYHTLESGFAGRRPLPSRARSMASDAPEPG
ncbi:MAG TPA: DUF2203 domain-containing protein [Thermoplasmata archaeon]|nr:DUF2203 domain-containing protein [Thermoplasmata archaeon]